MNDKKNITNLVVKLNKMTQNGELNWSSHNSRLALNDQEETVDKIYRTSYKGKYFRLFKYRSRDYTDEGVFYWITGWRLEITDENYNAEWTFPEERAVTDLYDSVRYQIVDVDDLLNELFSDE
ncbi:hypothetical protein NQT66_13215 [Cellulophaga baltica]|uniref:hypothetical protein n=1 Tax=Cellulophaga baltica TaxID=76594 RepID=UPI0021492B0B|nr:hypothetical protein [Cellulophaga baltica]MCR1025776.1 hypothetical protein [Cellulophaga baltica]